MSPSSIHSCVWPGSVGITGMRCARFWSLADGEGIASNPASAVTAAVSVRQENRLGRTGKRTRESGNFFILRYKRVESRYKARHLEMILQRYPRHVREADRDDQEKE